MCPSTPPSAGAGDQHRIDPMLMAGTPGAQRTRAPSRWADLGFFVVVAIAGAAVVVLALALVGVLLYNARASIGAFGFRYLYGVTWSPNGNIYGVVPFVAGTLITSAIALALAIPLALGSAVFLATRAPSWLRGAFGTAVELLAAIPS